MGYGTYSLNDRSIRTSTLNYESKTVHQIFTERSLNNAMDPKGVTIRESRDSEEHPESVAIIFALDVTGSMGSIPRQLIIEGLPTIMGTLIQRGVADPQLLLMAIGDHECDSSPLQVSQFETSDELLDHWLTKVYVESGGGGNDGESYSLAHYFAGYHTSIDCFEKRKQKGFLFTVGDEPTLKKYPSTAMQKIMGTPQASAYTAAELLDKAKETYNVYHLHVKEGSNGHSARVMNGWRELLGDNLIIVKNKNDIPKIIAETIYTVLQSQKTFPENTSTAEGLGGMQML